MRIYRTHNAYNIYYISSPYSPPSYRTDFVKTLTIGRQICVLSVVCVSGYKYLRFADIVQSRQFWRVLWLFGGRCVGEKYSCRAI